MYAQWAHVIDNRHPTASSERFSQWCSNRGAQQQGDSADGSVLIPLLGMFTACTLLSSILLAVASNLATVTSFRTLQRQVYWAARSAARNDIVQLSAGVDLPVASTLSIPGIVVTQTAVHVGVWSVVITARSGSVVNRLSFTWNPATRLATSWQDNGPS